MYYRLTVRPRGGAAKPGFTLRQAQKPLVEIIAMISYGQLGSFQGALFGDWPQFG
jgi:hypothetical protein